MAINYIGSLQPKPVKTELPISDSINAYDSTFYRRVNKGFVCDDKKALSNNIASIRSNLADNSTMVQIQRQESQNERKKVKL